MVLRAERQDLFDPLPPSSTLSIPRVHIFPIAMGPPIIHQRKDLGVRIDFPIEGIDSWQ